MTSQPLHAEKGRRVVEKREMTVGRGESTGTTLVVHSREANGSGLQAVSRLTAVSSDHRTVTVVYRDSRDSARACITECVPGSSSPPPPR